MPEGEVTLDEVAASPWLPLSQPGLPAQATGGPQECENVLMEFHPCRSGAWPGGAGARHSMDQPCSLTWSM